MTTWNLLRNEYRRKTKHWKRCISFEYASENNEGLFVPKDSSLDICLIDGEMEEKPLEHKRIKTAYENLNEDDRKILELREVEEKKWDEVAIKMKFKGTIQALRKRGSRALKRLRDIYLSL